MQKAAIPQGLLKMFFGIHLLWANVVRLLETLTSLQVGFQYFQDCMWFYKQIPNVSRIAQNVGDFIFYILCCTLKLFFLDLVRGVVRGGCAEGLCGLCGALGGALCGHQFMFGLYPWHELKLLAGPCVCSYSEDFLSALNARRDFVQKISDMLYTLV